MGVMDLLAGLVADVYAAALDDALWLPWASRSIEALGGAGGTLVLLDPEKRALNKISIMNLDQKALDEYLSGPLAGWDPQISYATGLDRSAIYLDTDHVDNDDPLTARHSAFMTGKARWHHHMTAAVKLDSLMGCLSVHRGVGDGYTPTEEQQKLQFIMPHMARAMELGFRNSERLSEAYWDGVAEGRSNPTVLLDEKGRVLRATPSFGALASDADGIDVIGDRMVAFVPSEDARLTALISRVLQGETPLSGAMQLSRRSGKPAYVVTVYPMARSRRFLAPFEASALITIMDPVAQPAAAGELYQDAFGFTARECDLARLLMAGHSIESAGAMLQIRLPTARIHLRRLLAKTSTARQSDLIRLLARLQ